MVLFPDQFEKFDSAFEEGGIYIIHNFFVRPYKENTLKSVNNNHQIWMSNRTEVTPVKSNDRLIPFQEFDIIDLDEIYKLFHENKMKYQLIGMFNIYFFHKQIYCITYLILICILDFI